MTRNLHLPIFTPPKDGREDELLLEEGDRPRTREDCALVPRPCPFVGCRHNNYLDVRGKRVELTWPGVEPEDVPPARSCALDIADGGESTLDDIGQVLGLTRERVRQIEAKALKHVRERKAGRVLAELAPEGRTVDGRRHTPSRDSEAPAGDNVPQDREYRRPDDDYTAGLQVSFFAEGEDADQLVADAVWRMFRRDSTSNGFDARTAASKRTTAWRKANPTRGRRVHFVGQIALAKGRAS